MLIDRGFYVDNYVGTYEMVHDEELGTTLIVSKEYNRARDGESPLAKKRIFEFDSKNDDYILLNLANLDIESDEAILDYCNKYGLPYSSQICYDSEYRIDLDVNFATAKVISDLHREKYSRQDTMSRDEFCRLAIQIRKMMELKTILDSKSLNRNTCSELIPLLIFFAFFSHEFVFDYDESAFHPQTRSVRIQYSFQIFRRLNCEILLLSPIRQIEVFLQYATYMSQNPKHLIGKDISVLSDLGSETFAKLSKMMSELLGESNDSYNNLFSYQNYGEIQFEDKIQYNGEMEDLLQLGVMIFCDIVNEGLGNASPQLVLENETIRGEWKLLFQIQGIYMEFFLELAKDSQYRKCANPTCDKFFSASRNRPNKMYCCHECAALQAKRRERSRNKMRLLDKQ